MKRLWIFSSFLMVTAAVLGQKYQVEKLITIEGSNRHVAIAPFSSMEIFDESYICWENQRDSLYTVYLKRLDYQNSALIAVCSDTNQNMNPSIDFYPPDGIVKIVWQTKVDTLWQLRTREMINGELGPFQTIGDTTVNNTNPCLDMGRLVWIQEGRLVYSDSRRGTFVIDSTECSNPSLCSYANAVDPMVVYEKGSAENKQIYSARYFGEFRGSAAHWETEQISSETYCINPRFGFLTDVAYQTLEEGVWKIMYMDSFYDEFKKTKNVMANFEHPMLFKYDVVTGEAAQAYTNFFLAFDSDSLGDQEIFVKERDMYSPVDTIYNISQSEGNDSRPVIAVVGSRDSSEVAIIWEHEEEGKREIWWATTPYHRMLGNVGSEHKSVQNFVIVQNYPNPFNSTTSIHYNLHKPAFVTLSIYNVHGELVRQLSREYQAQGEYVVEWNAEDSSSGLYFIRLSAGNEMKTVKAFYIK